MDELANVSYNEDCMQKRLVGISLLAAAFMAPALHAQGLGHKIEVGVFGQYTKLDSALVMDNVFGAGGRLGISVYKWLGVEGDIQVGKTKSNNTPFEDITYRPFRGLVTLTIPMSSHAGLVLGGGYLNSVFDGRASANEYEDGISGLVGLKLCGDGKWGARLDGIADYNPSPNEQALTGTSKNFGARVGITYALKGACGGEGEKFDWSLALAPATATVARGANRQFALSASDMKARPIEVRKVNDLVCRSSDATVATVDNTGNVTAVKAGTATITCSGMVKNLNRSASSTVTVPPPEWTFTLAPPTQTKDVGQTATYTTTARDADGVDLGAATSWTSSSPAVATIANGTATCVSAGNATITATKTAYGASKSATAALVCNALPTAMVRLDSTHFNFDRARVLPAGEALLQTVVDAMKRDPSIRISVEGHTDWYGDEAYNERLASSRAEAVTTILRRLGGSDIAADRISSLSYGERCILVRDGAADPGPPRPRVSAADKAKQAPNRRVEIWQLLPGRTGAAATCRTEAERAGRVPFDSMSR
jgi:outer membrane protein OmpA-like peptidoglycan-associated protein